MSKERTAKPGAIQKRALIRASAATVYRALTEAGELTEWFCDRAGADPRVGGLLTASWRCGRQIQCGCAVFRRLEPLRLLELEWLDDAVDAHAQAEPHTLRYMIRTRKDGCELIMNDDGCPLPDEDAMAALEEGWISLLRALKDHCEALERSLKSKRHPE